MMNISRAAKAAGLPTKTVRYYGDIGLVEPTERTASGYRSYDDAAVRNLIFVRRARAFDFSIDDCRELLTLAEDQRRSSAAVKEIATQRLRQIEEKQKELQLLRDDLAGVVGRCNGDDGPDCAILDYLK